MQDLYNFLADLLPSKMEQITYTIGGIIGAIFSFLFEGIDAGFYWLCAFMAVDYITGIMQAIINKNMSSKVGFKGLIKKSIIISVVVLFHGLAQIIKIPPMETAAIFAFALNEMFSILENIERAGLGKIIPPGVRQILEIAKSYEAKKIDELKKEEK